MNGALSWAYFLITMMTIPLTLVQDIHSSYQSNIFLTTWHIIIVQDSPSYWET